MSIEMEKSFLSLLGEIYDAAFFLEPSAAMPTTLARDGILILPGFLSPEALAALQEEAVALKGKAYRSTSSYNLFVSGHESNALAARSFATTKHCIPDDQIPRKSLLRRIYGAKMFRDFVCALEGLPAIYPYADSLSSVNINYYDPGDSLEWHFDNADFAITLLLKKCEKGGIYEYCPDVRYTDDGKEDSETLATIVNGQIDPERVSVEEGSLMIFRGNQSLHRVTLVEAGERVLVTLNYNRAPGISLSEESRKTFFGRLD